MARLGHLYNRIKELGFKGSIGRIITRSQSSLSKWGHSFWWGLVAQRGISDENLLSKLDGSWQTVSDLLEHFSNRPGGSFLLPHTSPDETREILHSCYPGKTSSILNDANKVYDGRLALFQQNIHINKRVNWHQDPFSDWSWPTLHVSRMDDLIWTQQTPSDPIPLWELNRHQYLITLAIAYWLTEEPHYLVTLIDHLESWIASNPLQHGIHWFYPLEVSIRLLAWVTIFQFIRHSQLFREQLGGLFIKYIYAQAHYVMTHLQNVRSEVPNNHLIAEATALAVIGAIFPEFRASKIWLDTGLNLLKEQMARQIHADGVHKEQAIGYHRFVSELVLIVVSLSRHGLLDRESILEDSLEKMLEYTSFALTPNNSVPLWGDSDYGRALGINHNEDFWDFRSLLAMGAILYNRAEWKYLANTFPIEAFWQLGQAGLDAWNHMDGSLPQETSRAFPEGGIYIIRDSWKRDTDVAFFRCGSFGLGGEGYCSHAHCDLLSPLLWIHGREVLVSSGTFTYFGPLRDYFRETSSKNTLMVDGYEQATAKTFFGWEDVPEAECLNWDGKRVTGVMQIRPGILHRRECNHPQPGTWEITDYVQSDAFHSLCWYFHFSPKLSLHQNEDIVLVRTKADDQPFVNIQVPSKVVVNIRKGWYSRWYGQKKPNPLFQATWQGRIPPDGTEFTWRFQNITKTREDIK